jgi:ankyrin repeat protein
MGRPERAVAPRLATLSFILAGLCLGTQQASARAAADPVEPARAAIRLKEYRVAVECLQPLAARGDAQAQYLLASLYRVGLGVAVDIPQARELLVAAAERRHVGAAYSLATLLATGQPADRAAAAAWLQRAADAGHPVAAAALQRGALPLQFLPHKDLTESDALRDALWLAAQQDDVQLASLLADAAMLRRTNDFGRGVLSVAAQSGAAKTAAMLLEHGALPNQADSYGITPLMLAARSANAAVLDVLLRSKAPLDAVDRGGNSALMHAASAGRDKAVKRLLDAGASVTVLNAQGWSALDWAVESQSVAAAELLQQRGLLPRRAPQKVAGSPAVPLHRAPAGDLYLGLTDIQVAASRSSPALLNSVLDHERAVGRTPLMPASVLLSAAVTGSPTTLDAVFAAGARAKQMRFGDPLPWLAMRGEPAALVAVLAHHRNVSGEPLLTAVAARRPDVVRALLNAHAGIDVVDDSGRTALMLAAASGQIDVARELLGHLARMDAVDEARRTALWYASAAGASEIVAALLAAGSAVDGIDAQGFTPLAIASAKGHAAIVDTLLRAGANANSQTGNGSKPLMLASQGGHTAVATRLLAAGARIDDQNRYGDTALIVAVRAGQIASVRQLLAAGASDNLRNADRASAFDVASALALPDIAALLQRG